MKENDVCLDCQGKICIQLDPDRRVKGDLKTGTAYVSKGRIEQCILRKDFDFDEWKKKFKKD